MPIYGFTTELATMAPPPPEMQQLLGAIQGDAEAMNGFAGVYAGTVSPAVFFDPTKGIGDDAVRHGSALA